MAAFWGLVREASDHVNPNLPWHLPAPDKATAARDAAHPHPADLMLDRLNFNAALKGPYMTKIQRPPAER